MGSIQIKVDPAVARRNHETSRRYRDLYLGENGQAAFEKFIANMAPEAQENQRQFLKQVRQMYGRN